MSLAAKQAMLVVVATFLAVADVSAEEPKVALEAEWIGPACQFPARFRVTLSNTGDEAFSVPLTQTLGRGRPINLVARLKEGVFAFNGEREFSSEYFAAPPYRPTEFVDLAPGDGEVFELWFDGIFDAHGGAAPTYDRWEGAIQFYYFLPPGIAGSAPAGSSPVLSSVQSASAWSNTLECA